MKPHPRIRKTVKWGGAVVTLLLVVVWVGSRWWTVMLGTAMNPRVLISNGAVWLGGNSESQLNSDRFHKQLDSITDFAQRELAALRATGKSEENPDVQRAQRTVDDLNEIAAAMTQHFFRTERGMRFLLWFDWRFKNQERNIAVPVWALALSVSIVTLLTWRRDARSRRIGADCCVNCGYDRLGLSTTAVCPECGASPMAALNVPVASTVDKDRT